MQTGDSVSVLRILSWFGRSKRQTTSETRATLVLSMSPWYPCLVMQPSLFLIVSPQCPIHKKLVDTTILTAEERAWLDAYHAETLAKVSPLLANDTRALEWLKRECSPL